MYDCNDANHAVNIKYKSYPQSTAANELLLIDMNRNAAQAYCNRGFAAPNLQLFIQPIPLSRYSFFDALLPNTTWT